MTTAVLARPTPEARSVRPRHFLMCAPTWFDVTYAINPWMDPTVPVNRSLALAQWTTLVDAFRAAGHRVELLEAVRGLPDMVFAANGATVIDGQVLVARFANPQRAAEASQHQAWHGHHGATYGRRTLQPPVGVNEAEGDFAVTATRILAGYGFRTTLAAHRELAALTGREVLSLQLVDPRFYHLDVALTVLDDETGHLAYYPPAFSPASQILLAQHYPDALIATEADADLLGLNCVSDGLNVFLPAHTERLGDQLVAAGYHPIEINLSELRKGGGSVKCCTQELRSAPGRTTAPIDPPATAEQGAS